MMDPWIADQMQHDRDLVDDHWEKALDANRDEAQDVLKRLRDCRDNVCNDYRLFARDDDLDCSGSGIDLAVKYWKDAWGL